MIYLYAVTEPRAEPPACTGLEDEPVLLLSGSYVGALYSRHDGASFAADAQSLWRHDEVVEAAMTQGPILPARFGTTFHGVDALAAALERNESRLRRQLERLRGCVELAVRVSLPGRDGSLPSDGLGYMRTKLAHRQERRAAAEQTLIPLAAHAVGTRTNGTDSDGDLTASYLVRVGDIEHFAERVSVLARGRPELSLSCTGPWPPYSFVEEER